MYTNNNDNEPKLTEAISMKRSLSPDDCVQGPENQQIDKKKKLSLENEIAEDERKSEFEQSASNEESKLEDNDDANASSSIKPERRRFEPECKLCHKRFYSATTYYLHIESQGHKKRITPIENFECKLCDRTLRGKSTYEAHVASKKHQKKLYNCQLGEKLNVDMSSLPSVRPTNATGPDFKLRCQICNKKFSGIITYDLHLSSPSHNRMVEKATLEKVASCTTCNLTFSGLTSYEIHMSSPLHMKNVQRAGTYGNCSFNNFL